MSEQPEQVGGNHYESEYQHWSWVIDAGLGYLEGCATKYVSRWWKKNGLQDLLKAKTYVQKMIVNYDAVYALSIEPPDDIDLINARFGKANKLPELEYQFCCLMSDWQSTQQLEFAMQLLDSLITSAQRAQEAGLPLAAPAPAPAPGMGPEAAKTGGPGRAGCATTQAPASSASTEVASMPSMVGSGNPEAHDYLGGLENRGRTEHPSPFGYEEGDG